MRNDIRLAIRALRRRPGFVATVVLSLALAIGASAAAFSVVDAVRFRALPFVDGDQLVLLSEVPVPAAGRSSAPAAGCRAACDVSYTTYSKTLRTFPFRTLTSVTAHASGGKALTIRGETETIIGTIVSENMFAALRVAPIRGRAFTPEDNQLGAPPVALMSYQLWTTRFGQDPSIVGTPVQLSDTRYTIIGIMPQGFDFESDARFWLPIVPTLDPSTRPSIRSVTVIGHLARGATIEQVRAELAGMEKTVSAPQAGGSVTRSELTALPLRDRYTTATQGHDVMFFAVVCCVLLIACANLTNLLLARALDRQREFAVRAALGAERGQLARHLFVEHGLLVALGAALGIAFAAGFLAIIRTLTVLDTFRPTGMEYRIDAHVVAFAVAVAAVAAILVSLVPVRLVAGSDARLALRESSASASGGAGANRAQRVFVAAQVACAVMLLIAGGLAVRTTLFLSRVDLGFDATHLVQGAPSLPHDWRVKEKYLPAIARIQAALAEIPSVTSVGTRATIALGSGRTPVAITIVGQGAPISPADVPTSSLAVDPGYFATLKIPVARGRAFTSQDVEQSAAVAMVNETAAARWWAGRDPVGTQIRVDTLPNQSAVLTIVGVVKDNKAGRGNLLLATDGPELYRPFLQAPSAFPAFFVRTAGAPAAVLQSTRVKFSELVPNRPASATIVADVVNRQLGSVRTTAMQILAFAAIGLVLAFVGIYGVLSYSVKRRTRELGIRRALGATVPGVYSLIVRDAVWLTVPGVLAGALGAILTGRVIAPLLHGTKPTDGLTYATIAIAVLLTAVASALIPARRAARVSPLIAIRES